MLEAAGWPGLKGSLETTAMRLGIEPVTLSRWARRTSNPPPDNLVAEKRDILKDMVDRVLFGFGNELIARVLDGSLQDDSTSDILKGWGISIDKAQLLAGKPTQRIATIQEELAETPEDERAAVIAEAEEILRSGAMGSSGSEA
jgi:hypothetical protein